MSHSILFSLAATAHTSAQGRGGLRRRSNVFAHEIFRKHFKEEKAPPYTWARYQEWLLKGNQQKAAAQLQKLQQELVDIINIAEASEWPKKAAAWRGVQDEVANRVREGTAAGYKIVMSH